MNRRAATAWTSGLAWVALAGVGQVPAGGAMELGRGAVSNTNVAVTVRLDSEGRVLSCRSGPRGQAACLSFPKGRVVSLPLRRNGRPVRGRMTVSTTTVVSAE
jgi:hypothetical protein